MGMKQLTKAQRRCLGNIIALGGSRGTGMGRDRVGMVRERTVRDLYAAGLVEADPTGPRFPDGALIIGTRTTIWQATAAGCIAFGPEVAVVS